MIILEIYFKGHLKSSFKYMTTFPISFFPKINRKVIAFHSSWKMNCTCTIRPEKAFCLSFEISCGLKLRIKPLISAFFITECEICQQEIFHSADYSLVWAVPASAKYSVMKKKILLKFISLYVDIFLLKV